MGHEVGWSVGLVECGCACCECSEHWECLNTVYMDAVNALIVYMDSVNVRNA